MLAYRKLIRNGRCHIQVHGTTGCGKSRQVPSVTAEEVSYRGQTIVLTTSTVDVTGMQHDAWVPSCYRMGDRLSGGENIHRFHCQFFNVLSCVWFFELQMIQWYRGTCLHARYTHHLHGTFIHISFSSVGTDIFYVQSCLCD